MKKNKVGGKAPAVSRRDGVSYSLRRMVTAALLVAMSVVCGKYLQIPVGDVMRFSFENLPILLASFALGPIMGAAVGIVADLIGCVLVGYAVNPLVTLGAAAIGFFGGLLYRLCRRVYPWIRVLISVLAAHTIGSVLIKTFGLSQFYAMPFTMLLLWRLLNYVIVATMEFLLLYILLRSKAIQSQLNQLSKQK